MTGEPEYEIWCQLRHRTDTSIEAAPNSEASALQSSGGGSGRNSSRNNRDTTPPDTGGRLTAMTYPGGHDENASVATVPAGSAQNLEQCGYPQRTSADGEISVQEPNPPKALTDTEIALRRAVEELGNRADLLDPKKGLTPAARRDLGLLRQQAYYTIE